jgi:hypothetical protein
MTGLLAHIGVSLRLHFRNRMALLYGYLFPTIFLVAFWVLYRHEPVPLIRHLGELLTVTVLGGACFGLPTTMVGERERGVWRRYRLTPVPPLNLVAGTVGARYALLLVAGALQIGLALAIGMPRPGHPFELFLAFTVVAFAFLGMGLVIAMMADNVPAVQALGQCIFLPMLIIGGIAVPIDSLPLWAQRVSAFFPGRYAVDALQASASGPGLDSARFSVLAMLLVGAAGCLAGAGMFRWDAQQRFASGGRKGWVLVALAAWAAVGVLAGARGGESAGAQAAAPSAPSVTSEPASPNQPSGGEPPASTAVSPPAPPPRIAPPPREEPAVTPRAEPRPARPAADAPSRLTWQGITSEHIEKMLGGKELPPDAGWVAPIAGANDPLWPELERELAHLRSTLPAWPPGRVSDPVQRVRNYLLVPAAADILRIPGEGYVPRVVFDRLRKDIPKGQLEKILCWIAQNPAEGDLKAIDQLPIVGLAKDAAHRDQIRQRLEEIRERVAIYALKLLGRLTGRFPE